MAEKDFWQKLRAEFGIRKVSSEEHLMTRTFEKSLAKMPGMYELVDELKSKGIKFVLPSNVSPEFAEVLEREGHYEPFELKILSYQVGTSKPEAKIYQLALRKAGVKADEVVFIDDTSQNVEAAKALGIHGIVFQNTGQLKAELAALIK